MNSHEAASGQEVCRFRATGLMFLLVFLSLLEVRAGTALRLYYQNIGGDTVAEMLSHPSFPVSPSSIEVISKQMERIERGGDHWGSWTRGYLEAPLTGKHTFYLASDNNTEFWLSTTHLPFQVRKIMENTGVTPAPEYKVRSEGIELVQGEKYYFELYHKEGVGLDNVSVGWELPDGTQERPIPSRRLMPVPVDRQFQTEEKAPEFLSNYFSRAVASLTNVTAAEGETILLEASLEGTQPITLQWLKNGSPIPGANLASLLLTNLPISAGETYLLSASNELGTADAEMTLKVVRDDISLALTAALNLGSSNTIAVIFSKAVDPVSASVPSNYVLNNGAVVKTAKLVSRNAVHLIAASLQSGKSYTVKAKNVKDLARRNVIAEQTPLEIDKGLSLWLQFDAKDENDVVPDGSGNYNSAVLVNGAGLNRQGVLGSCLELDGVDDHAILPSGFENFTNGMTVTLWAKPTSNGFWGRFIDLGNGEARQNILFARESRSDHLVFETYRTQLKKAIARDVIGQNQWQHLAASMDAKGNVSLYKDGVLVGQQPTNVPVVGQRTSNLIGRSNWDLDAHYKGYMDDLRIYDRPLGAAEVEALAAGTGFTSR